MQRVAFSPIAFVGLCLRLCVCMPRWWISGRRFKINPPFFHHPIEHTNDVFSDILAHELYVFCNGQILKMRNFHSGERPFRCDERRHCCTQSSAVDRHKFTRSSKRPFKCDECEFKCDEGDICGNTNRQLTRHKRARRLKVFFT